MERAKRVSFVLHDIIDSHKILLIFVSEEIAVVVPLKLPILDFVLLSSDSFLCILDFGAEGGGGGELPVVGFALKIFFGAVDKLVAHTFVLPAKLSISIIKNTAIKLVIV